MSADEPPTPPTPPRVPASAPPPAPPTGPPSGPASSGGATPGDPAAGSSIADGIPPGSATSAGWAPSDSAGPGAGAAADVQGRADWPAQAADAVVDAVGKVRDATTGRLLTLARGVVYGTAIVVLAITLLVLLIIGAIRLLDAVLPGEVWSAYLVLGAVCTAVGLLLWSLRRPRTA